MVYQGHDAGGAGGYDGPTHQGINTAYFDKGDDDSPFEQYKDGDYNKKDENSPGGGYNKKEEEGQKKEEQKKEKEGKHKDTLMDAVEKEEKKTKEQQKKDLPKTAAQEIMHNQKSIKDNQDKKPKDTKAHKSIEEAINDASKDKKEAFVLE